jgi:hypothetical protein
MRCPSDHCSVHQSPSWWSNLARRIHGEWSAFESHRNLGALLEFSHGFARLLASAPTGSGLTQKARASIDRELRAAALAGDVEGAERVVDSSINAIELDRLGLQPVRRRVRAGARTSLELGRLGRATLHRVARGGSLGARVDSGVPGVFEGYAPGFPMATYRLDFSGALAVGAEVDLELALGYTSFSRPLETLRLFEWDGARYRDVTRDVDAQRGLIRGRTDRLASYVIMQPGFEATAETQPPCPVWQRILRRCSASPALP